MIEFEDGSRPASEMGLLVMPQDLDRLITQSARLIGYGINLALHEGLTLEQMEQFVF